jgi:hypothetical protein
MRHTCTLKVGKDFIEEYVDGTLTLTVTKPHVDDRDSALLASMVLYFVDRGESVTVEALVQ